jgi:hypothetical protein
MFAGFLCVALEEELHSRTCVNVKITANNEIRSERKILFHCQVGIPVALTISSLTVEAVHLSSFVEVDFLQRSGGVVVLKA